MIINPYRYAASGGGSDPYWSNVVALLHFGGADGSTTMTDETGKAWTAGGSAQIDTGVTGPFGDPTLLLTASDYVETNSASTDFAFGTGDFTIECWKRYTSAASNRAIFRPNDNNNVFLLQDSSELKIYDNGFHCDTPGGFMNTWVHSAWVRASGVDKVYLDGVPSSGWTGGINYSTSGKARIGAQAAIFTTGIVGNLAELRVTKGVARYTAAFTPPTSPFPNS